MFAQKLKQSCKFISVSLGLLSSYFSYQYQQTVEKNVDKTFLKNFQQMQEWVRGKSSFAFNCTETYLLQYLQKLSSSPLFHQMDVTSLLIFFANSQNIMLHGLFVKLLSAVNFPDDVNMNYYINQCNMKTLIGLARSQQFDLKWFTDKPETMPSIEYYSDEEIILNIQENLEKLFKELDDLSLADPADTCIQSMFSQLKYELPDDPVLNVMVDLCTERDNLQFTSPKKVIFKEHIFMYLDILRRYSNKDDVISNRNITERIVLILQKLLILFSETEKVEIICGNILANLALNNNNHELISDFIPLIMKWKLGSKNSLRITADRILHNLDDLVNNYELLSDGVYILHPDQREIEEPNIDVVFVHGINGSPFYTWRQNKSSSNQHSYTNCWPKDWLPADYPNARILSLQYDSSLSEWLLACPSEKQKYSLDSQAKAFQEKLRKLGLGKRPILWVAHSMGGLIVKKMILSNVNSDIVNATKGFVFYSVPHLGSPIATQSEKAGFILFPSVEVSELSETSLNLQQLHKKFAKFVSKSDVQCVDFGESKPLVLPYIKLKSMVVPRSSSDVGYGRYIVVDSNHQDICKPNTRVDVRYAEVVRMIRLSQTRKK